MTSTSQGNGHCERHEERDIDTEFHLCAVSCLDVEGISGRMSAAYEGLFQESTFYVLQMNHVAVVSTEHRLKDGIEITQFSRLHLMLTIAFMPELMRQFFFMYRYI